MNPTNEMTLSPAVGLAFADALERELGDGTVLTVGSHRGSVEEVVGDEPTRVVVMTVALGDDASGTLAFVSLASLAERLENAAPDEMLLTSCGSAFAAAAEQIAALLGTRVDPGRPGQADLDSFINMRGDAEQVVYPILDGTAPVACLALVLGAPRTPTTSGDDRLLRVAERADSGDRGSEDTLILAGVQMGVTAELGRCRMSVRELLSLSPGAVIDLDQPAGAPVDIVANGTLIARGEVVVVEEEFGVRITEILEQESSAR
jgi:flagellar motor switch protein FliN/FliY